MSHPHSNTSTTVVNNEALNTLARALMLPRKRFSLIVARCNSDDIRYSVVEKLQDDYPIHIQTLSLEKTAQNLYEEVQALSSIQPPSTLSITGLNTVQSLDELLVLANRMRNRFRQEFQFPMVVWANDAVLNRLIRLAPDFYSWAGTPILFDQTSSQPISTWLVQQAT